jgi:hypothetical protein
MHPGVRKPIKLFAKMLCLSVNRGLPRLLSCLLPFILVCSAGGGGSDAQLFALLFTLFLPGDNGARTPDVSPNAQSCGKCGLHLETFFTLAHFKSGVNRRILEFLAGLTTYFDQDTLRNKTFKKV